MNITAEEFYNKYALHYVIYLGPNFGSISSGTPVLIVGFIEATGGIVFSSIQDGHDLKDSSYIKFHPLYTAYNKFGLSCYMDILDPTNAYPSAYLKGKSISITNYPHKCPKCNNPAYIGFNNIDCSKNCSI